MQHSKLKFVQFGGTLILMQCHGPDSGGNWSPWEAIPAGQSSDDWQAPPVDKPWEIVTVEASAP